MFLNYENIAIFSYFLIIIGFFVVQKNEIAYLGRKAFFKNKNNWVDMLFVFVVTLSICFLLPLLNNGFIGYDSSVYTYIGRMMKKGYVPYKDMFDHKGPLMYFIQWLACTISPNSGLGIWGIQFLHVFISGFFSYLTTRLFTRNRVAIYLTILIGYLFCPYICKMFTNDGGNYVEIYALPWISSSLYIFLRYFKVKTFKFYEIMLVGVGFIATFLLRVNMVATWLIAIVVFVQMCIKKEWKNIGKCIGAFFAGVSIILIPTLIYLLATNSLKDMFECYIIFNLFYTGSSGGIIATINSTRSFIFKGGLSFYTILFVLSLFYKNKNTAYWTSLIFYILSLMSCCVSGRGYLHYFIVQIPFVVVLSIYGILSIYDLMDMEKIKTKRGRFKINNIIITVLAIIMVPASFYLFAYRNKGERLGITVEEQYIIENTQKDDDVLIINASENYTSIMKYLNTERYTKNKYFYQFPIIDLNDELYNDFIKEIDRVNSDVVVVLGKKEKVLVETNNICKICQKLEQDYINGKYTCEEFEEFYVYRLK